MDVQYFFWKNLCIHFGNPYNFLNITYENHKILTKC